VENKLQTLEQKSEITNGSYERKKTERNQEENETMK